MVNEHGPESSPAWQPVFLADHSHWARMLVPDGEVVFGQLADPPPSCSNVSSFGRYLAVSASDCESVPDSDSDSDSDPVSVSLSLGDPLLGPIADLKQHRGNTFIFATIQMLAKLSASEHLKAGVCAVMTQSWENYQQRMVSYGRAMGCREFPRPFCSSTVP